MIGPTLGITFVFLILALSRRSGGAALGLVIMSMMVWPEYLRVPVGLAEMSAPRLVGLFLILKYFVKGQHRRIGPSRVDTLVIVIWIWTVAATVMMGADFSHVTQMIGRGFDTVMMYFLARFCLVSSDDVKGLYSALAITALFMCGMGTYETITSYSPYSSMISYSGGNWYDKDLEYRYGFLRAQGSTAHSIYFGISMMLLAGFILSLRGYFKNNLLRHIVFLAAIVGALSSMSSGPFIGCFLLIVLNAYIRRTSLIKPSVYALIFVAILLELLSNRHFYNLIDYLALDKQTAWYRTRLLEVAVSQWTDFWLLGVGSNWPHHWALMLDGRNHIDVVNYFLIIALYGGLPAMLMYIATHVIAIRKSVSAWKTDIDDAKRKLIFGLSATLVALDFSSMSVGLFGPPLLLSHILLGMLVSAPQVVNYGSNLIPGNKLATPPGPQ